MALEQVMSTDLVPLAAAAGDAEMLKRALSKDSTDVCSLCGTCLIYHLTQHVAYFGCKEFNFFFLGII